MFKRKNYYQELLAQLYFVEGLEDVRALNILKRPYLDKWTKENGELICQVVFALIMGEDPKRILKELSEDSTGGTK